MLIAVAVSSCAKDELESPHQDAQPNAVMMQADDIQTHQRTVPVIQPSAAEINDDGDDETAGPPPNGKDN